ncbi:MAG: hypothetical protein VSS75_030755 [Candidatus Parabeggiatoa sp.]|nr:hypothetical protein [Candidatus Parabeggiatoa sp.]
MLRVSVRTRCFASQFARDTSCIRDAKHRVSTNPSKHLTRTERQIETRSIASLRFHQNT